MIKGHHVTLSCAVIPKKSLGTQERSPIIKGWADMPDAGRICDKIFDRSPTSPVRILFLCVGLRSLQSGVSSRFYPNATRA
jgi:hypothetical protein